MKKFIWVVGSCETRAGVKLIRGEVYEASAFSPSVVEEWVRTGAAEWVAAPKKSMKEN